MGRVKEYYHDLLMWQYYCDAYQDAAMPLWVLEQYGMPPSVATEQFGIRVEEPQPTEQDMVDAYEAMNHETEALDEEYRNLAVGEKMLIDVVFDDDGTAYPQYITKE
tara:strand:+ start:98 stop:418 length:321 start_codon:yes stop_codon:yes gene_type:complete